VLEKDFAKYVEQVLTLNGWTWKHDLPGVTQSGRWATSFRGVAGFPDYIACRGERIICAEIKNEKGRLTNGQKLWIQALQATGKIEVYVWRPEDASRIADLLSR
jgi:hypothetical protein